MLTYEEVRHVAMLARLGLSDGEVEQFRGQLGEVLDYVAMLQKIDTSTLEATARVTGSHDVTRADEPGSCLQVDEVLANAPAREDDFFEVPAVLEEFKAEPVLPGESEPDLEHLDG